MLLFLVLLIFVKTDCGKCQNIYNIAKECFIRKSHHGISNSMPLGEFLQISAYDCLYHCISHAGPNGYGCISVVYHKHFSSCQLYAHDGTFGDSRLVYATGHDYYKRVGYEGICKEKQAPIYGYLQERPRLHGNLQTPTNRPLMIDSSLVEHNSNYANKPNPGNDFIRKKNNQKSFLSGLMTTCPQDYAYTYLLIENYKVGRAIPSAIIKGVNLRNCINLCSLNMDLHEEKVPCAIASYNKTNGVCKLYDDTQRYVNMLNRIQPNDKSDYVEKFCMPKNLECSLGFNLKAYPKRQINYDPVKTISEVDSLTECIILCVDEVWCYSSTFIRGTCKLYNVKIELCFNILADTEDDTVTVSGRCDIHKQNKAEFSSVCEYTN